MTGQEIEQKIRALKETKRNLIETANLIDPTGEYAGAYTDNIDEEIDRLEQLFLNTK